MRKYFDSMVAYRVAGLVSTLTALSVRLMAEAEGMSPEDMDAELDRLEAVRRVLSGE